MSEVIGPAQLANVEIEVRNGVMTISGDLDLPGTSRGFPEWSSSINRRVLPLQGTPPSRFGLPGRGFVVV